MAASKWHSRRVSWTTAAPVSVGLATWSVASRSAAIEDTQPQVANTEPMSPQEFKRRLVGPITVIATPFDAQLEVDDQGLRNMVDGAKRNGCQVFALTAGDSRYGRYMRGWTHGCWHASLEHFGVAPRYLRPPDKKFGPDEIAELRRMFDEMGLQPEPTQR